jgi:hypothetical protein
MKQTKYGWCSLIEIKIFGELDRKIKQKRRTILKWTVFLVCIKKKVRLSKLIGKSVKDKNFT